MNADEFLARVQRSAGLASRQESEAWVLAVLVSLSDLLPDSEIRRHFISQVPGLLKSRLLEEPPRGLVMTRDAFVQHVGKTLGIHARRAETAIRAVYGVLKEAVSAGQLADVEAHVPKEVASLLQEPP